MKPFGTRVEDMAAIGMALSQSANVLTTLDQHNAGARLKQS